MKRLRCAVFISGRGSNLGVLLAASMNIAVTLVISNRAEAYGLVRAREAQVPTMVLEAAVDWDALQTQLSALEIDVIFLAGFLKVIPETFVRQWEGRIFNIHPSLLPKYKGLKSIQRAFEDRADIGASLHRVIPEVDGGEVLFQDVAVRGSALGEMNLEDVIARTHEVEHQLVRKWIEACPKLLMS